jgi:hypothetical protein
MAYTLWSRGRLLGKSPLDFIRCMPKLRTGFLYPSPLGEKLLPVAGGTSAAAVAFSKALRARPEPKSQEDMERLPEYADWVSATDECEALALELRGPDGTVIPTDHICVRDLEFLLTLSEESIERELEKEWCERSPEIEEETLHTLGLDDWDASWDATEDEDDLFGDFDDLPAEPWRAEPEEREWPRYQLQVELVDDSSIP